MSRLRDKIDAEMEGIESSLALLPAVDRLSRLSELELAGVSALLNSFYNGAENILKQILIEKGIALPAGESWHRDLLIAAQKNGIISSDLCDKLKLYMAFRHFFSHAYVLDVDPHRIEPLVAELPGLLQKLKAELQVIV